MAHLHRGEPELAKKIIVNFILGHLAEYQFHDRRSVMALFHDEYQSRLRENTSVAPP
jgi:hypothetical protein